MNDFGNFQVFCAAMDDSQILINFTIFICGVVLGAIIGWQLRDYASATRKK